MPVFLKKAARHFTEAERAGLIFHLASNPEAGDVMPENGRRSEDPLGRKRPGQERRSPGDLLFP
jgi:hypothetical protein